MSFFSFVMIWCDLLFRCTFIIVFGCLIAEALHTELAAFTEFQLDACSILPGFVVSHLTPIDFLEVNKTDVNFLFTF